MMIQRERTKEEDKRRGEKNIRLLSHCLLMRGPLHIVLPVPIRPIRHCVNISERGVSSENVCVCVGVHRREKERRGESVGTFIFPSFSFFEKGMKERGGRVGPADQRSRRALCVSVQSYKCMVPSPFFFFSFSV